MLDTIHANAKTAAFNAAYAAIGNEGETKMPRAKGNLEPVAWEYHVSCHLFRIAEARKKKAQSVAIAAGVLFDHEKQPLAVGSNALIYAGDLVEISVSVTTPASKLDMPSLIAALEKAGLKRAVIDKAVAKCTTENRAPHKFVSTLVTSLPGPAGA